MSKYVVLSARSFDFTNDRNERIQGLKVSYINPNIDRENVKGYEPMLATIPTDFEKQLDQVPGKYEMDFEVVTGPKNKPQLQLCNLQYVEPVIF